MDKNSNKLNKILWILRIISLIFIVGGIVMLTIKFTNNLMSIGLTIGGSFSLFIGFATMMFSLIPVIQKAMIKLNKHIINENKDDLQEISTSSSEIMSQGIKNISKSAADGYNEAMDSEKIFCKYCGEKIDKDSKFCSHCGKKL